MGVFDNWNTEDIYRYRDNKMKWHSTDNDAFKSVYSLNNDNIRALYGMDKSQDVSLGEVNAYIAELEKQQARDTQKNALLTNLTNYANNGSDRVNRSAQAIRNFNYDPSKDAAYNIYADMYGRQGQSAAKNTLNNLNSANMGRNSSYSAAATAQVQQAYAQKASEMIPTLAQQAYDKLLQQYSLERDLYDDSFNKQLSLYQLLADNETRELTNRQLREDNEYNKWAHDMEYKYLPIERDQSIANNAETIKQNQIRTQSAQLELDVLPQLISQEIQKGELQNIAAALSNQNMEYQNKIAAITLEIQQLYGLNMAEAEYVARKLENQISQKQYNYL